MTKINKNSYRLKCRLLARNCAKLKLLPAQIPQYLSSNKWFMKLNGVEYFNNKNRLLNPNGAYNQLGEAWCNKCMEEELIKTEFYIHNIIDNDKTNINSFFKLKINTEK